MLRGLGRLRYGSTTRVLQAHGRVGGVPLDICAEQKRSMAGHSKWANIKHRKGKQDLKKAKENAKLVRAVFVASSFGQWPHLLFCCS